MVTANSTREGLIKAAQGLRPLIEAYKEDGEQNRRLPAPVMQGFIDAGLMRIWKPREFGGNEVDPLTMLDLIEDISRRDGAAGWTFMILATGGATAAMFPQKGASEIFGSGPDVILCGALAPKGRAVPVEGGYRVSGRWPLASGCHHASWFMGGTMVFENGAPRPGPMGFPEPMMVAMPASEVQILDTWNSVGLRGTGSNDFEVQDIFVPDYRLFHAFSGRPTYVQGNLYKSGLLPLFSTMIAPVAIGIARAAFDSFIELAKTKTPSLSQTPLAARATLHADLAKAQALVGSARSYLREAVQDMGDALDATGEIPEALEVRRRLACVNAATACAQAVDIVYTHAGSTAVYSGNIFERCLRDIRALTQHAAVTPTWWEKTGQWYLGLGLGRP